MDLSNLFRTLHGMINEDELVSCMNMQDDVLEVFGITKEEVSSLADELGVSNEFFYLNKEGGIFPFCYWDGFFYYGFHSLQPRITQGLDSGGKYSDVRRFKGQYERIREHFENKEWSSLLAMSDKKVSFLVFRYIKEIIPVDQRKHLFLEEYVRNEYGFHELDKHMVREILSLKSPEQFSLPVGYEPDEEGYYTIYRGETPQSTPIDKTYSWTLGFNIASFFANRFNASGDVRVGKVHKDKVKAFIANKNEAEVIVFPEDIILIK